MLPSPANVLALANVVTTAFIAANSPGDCLWERATYFFGHTQMTPLSNSSEALAFAIAWADGNHYECSDSLAINDIGSGWGYAELYAQAPADYKLALGITMSREIALGSKTLPPYSWWWVDSLAMNVAQWSSYGALLGRSDFWDLATAQYNFTKYGVLGNKTQQPGLWLPEAGLWYRDARFVNSTVFWARGNAWAAATALKTLGDGALPSSHPLSIDLDATLRAMAAALLPLQGADGFWRASLHNASSFPGPETTGTAGFVAMMAFGVRTGRLSASVYTPAIVAGWAALELASSARGDGLPGYCQPVGDRPGPAAANDTSDFCAGFVLLAAAEVYKLVVSGKALLV